MVIEGIDVSNWQGQIDWNKVKQKDVQFAYIKATEGIAYLNSNFKNDWDSTKQAGILRGAYHFFDPTKSVKDQVEHYISTVGSITGDLPPMLDLEGNKWSAIPSQARLAMAKAWLDAIESHYLVTPIVYTNFYFARDVLQTAGHSELSKYRLWIANYNNVQSPKIPEPWLYYTFWQYTSTAKVSGIEGPVDKNKFPGTLDDLKLLTRNLAVGFK